MVQTIESLGAKRAWTIVAMLSPILSLVFEAMGYDGKIMPVWFAITGKLACVTFMIWGIFIACDASISVTTSVIAIKEDILRSIKASFAKYIEFVSTNSAKIMANVLIIIGSFILLILLSGNSGKAMDSEDFFTGIGMSVIAISCGIFVICYNPIPLAEEKKKISPVMEHHEKIFHELHARDLGNSYEQALKISSSFGPSHMEIISNLLLFAVEQGKVGEVLNCLENYREEHKYMAPEAIGYHFRTPIFFEGLYALLRIKPGQWHSRLMESTNMPKNCSENESS